MCYRCYEEEGKPSIINTNVIRAANIIDAIYEYSCVGSNMHIVIDDWNTDDECIEMCRDKFIPENIHNVSPVRANLEIELCDLLLSMSESERVTALAVSKEYGFIPSQV